jgi:hypothetical protein
MPLSVEPVRRNTERLVHGRHLTRPSRILLALVLLLLPGVLVPAPAHAGYDDACSAGAITDRVDGTTKVYGGGWVTCGGRGVEHLRLAVTLFRNGEPIRHVVCERFGAQRCTASVAVVDRRPGRQTWRTKAVAKWKPYGWWLTYEDVAWSPRLRR